MSPAAPTRLALALGLGLWLGALAGGPGRGCGPCAPPCLCSSAPGAACRVNCSGRGLRTLGPALRIPADATALDISHNLLRVLDIGLLANLSALVELDISNNEISTLEEGIFTNLFNLSEINLGGNPFECDCGLVWLVRWVEEQQIHVVQPEAATCAGPGPLAGQPLLGIPSQDGSCGEEYIACLPDNSSGAMVMAAFSTAHEGLLEPEACSAFCFSAGHDLAALSEQGWCLCGAAQSPNTSSACLSLCSGPLLPFPPACTGPTLLQHVFPASPGATLVGPHGPLASGQPATFHIAAPLPISSARWDFGDGSPKVGVAGPASVHRFVLPGRYHVTAILALGAVSVPLETEVQVEAAPAAVELVCPSSVRSGESLELGIQNRGGSGLQATYSIVALGEEPAQVVHPLCPSDTEIYPGNGHCYRLVVEKEAWLQAQEQCRIWAGAALAMVDSPALQHFLVSQVTRSLDVWIGFSAMQGAEVGLAPQGEAFSLESCQNWLPGEPHPASAEHCVRLGPAGRCNTDLCSAPHSYVCELRPGGPVWDAENFFVGVPSRDLQGPLRPLAQQEALLAPQQPVEVMVFPGLELSREAFLTTAEFGTQELSQSAQLRLQVHRPLREAGVPENSSELESGSLDNRTEPAPECVPEGRWCPGANVCVPLDASCHPQSCASGFISGPGLCRATYTLWREFLFSIPPGPPAQYSVTLLGQDVLMLPGDLIGLQHDAGPGAFLHCPLAPGHPGLHAPYLSANASGWLAHLPTQLEGAQAGPACALRLLGATERFTPLLGLRPNPGLRRPGRYEVRAMVGNSVSRHNLSCSFSVVSPVAGLRVIHPAPHDGHLYLPTNGSALVLQVDSGANATATARWPGGSVSAPFEAVCPAVVVTLMPGCPRKTNDTLFSVLALPRLSEGEHTVEVMAENSAGCVNLSLRVTAEEPIYGLRAMPSPEARVLQGVLVRYSPVVEAGSDVVFRWTIDDKQSLTFHNVVFNVIYQSAAIFKLSLTASNHVSNVTVNYNVSVERMNRMRGLQVSTVPAVLPLNVTLALTASVLVDSAVEVAFLWTFGDGEQALSQFKPPYVESFQVPDPAVAQVLVEHNATHTYTSPGEYSLTVLVSNAFENLTKQMPVSVRAPLPTVAVGMSSGVLVTGQPVTFYPHPLPSPGGILYTWDFGDSSPILKQSHSMVNHTYALRGTYLVRLEANNTVSSVAAHADVHVFEELRGLSVHTTPAVEQGAPIVVSAIVEMGDNITWIFDMGDGTVLTGPEATVEHVYLQAQNYTVIVSAASPAGHLAQSLQVQVFVLEVLRIEPATCIPTQPNARLMAHVTGDPEHYQFDWTFGDGSSNITIQGCPVVIHNFTQSGTFPLALVLSSHVNKAHYFTSICVEPEVGNVTLQPERQFVQLGDEARLVAHAWPPYPYRYTWDLGTEDATPSCTWGPEVTFTYGDPGSYLVTVTASNNVSAANDSAVVEVQEPVVLSGIRVNSSQVLELQQPYLFSVLGRGHPAAYLWELGDGEWLEGPEVIHAYNSTGDFTIRVAGWNGVSHSEAWLNVTVQQRVRGLSLNASRTAVPLNSSVSFSTSLEAGSDVQYSWVLCDRCTPIPGGPTISYTFRSVGTFNIIVTAENKVGGAGTEVLPGPRFSYSFPWVGDHVVSVQAENHVSRAQAQIRILVLEAVSGLHVPNCCEPGIATGTERNFTARVQRGSRVAYAWYFSLQKVQGDSLVILSGRDVTYTPVAAGLLEINVRAFNALGSENRTLVVEVQDVIQYVQLQSGRCFTNRSAQFEAATSPSPRRVAYHWDFGDGAPVQDTDEPWAEHSYLQPGDYRVQVNASNLVSFFVAQATVTVQVLACREPEVDVALPLQVLMRRSQRNYLEAHIDLRDCVTYQTEYRWEVYRAASCQRRGRMTPVALPGVDVSRPQLVVPRLVLPVGHYCFVFVVSFGDTPLARSIQANVTMAPERLVPIIEGGSYRVWSDTQDLVLDGSKSYDPNLEDGDQTPLSFHWACVASTQSETGGCALNFGPRGSSVVTIPQERLEAGVEYTFNLTVWKVGRKEEATNQTVLIRSGRVPIVSLECVSCKAQAVYEVSRSSHVYLEGRCHNCSPGSKRGRWAARTFSNKTLVLDETTTSTGSAGMRLVVRQGVLRDGEGYTFTLTVLGHSGEEEGCASIRLSPNSPPLGGLCRLFPLDAVSALTTKVHFECTGWRDAEDAGAPLVYALLLQRCRRGHCEEFCIYKGSLSTYGAVLPPGFRPHFEVGLAVVVQDQLGASVVALNRSVAITLPEPNGSTSGLSAWLHGLTASVLPGLLRQADPQHVIEYSLALVTVLNEYEQAPNMAAESNQEQHLRAQIRKNITETLVSLRVNTVDDIQQIAAALAQCMVSSRELVCRSCLKQTLHKLEGMMRVLQAETTEGTVTPTAIADSILNITGDLIYLGNSDMQGLQLSELGAEPPSVMVASKAYNLSSALMCILMRSRVLNEEPLTLVAEEIVAQGKRSDPLSLLCYGNASGPGCHFSIPEAFSGALSHLSDVVQLIFLVDSNPFPFGYISNYTVSTKVVSMAFQTQAGTQIPIERLASERAITVKVPNNSDQAAWSHHTPAGSVVVQPRASVSAVVTPDNSNPKAGLHLQVTYTLLSGRYLSEEPEPYLAVYLHTVPQPNERNCSASRRISLEVLESDDHRPYTFFIAPGTEDLSGSYYLNFTSHFHWSVLEVSVGLYTSLCQYFSEEEMMWKTEGLVPLEETSPTQAVCLTRHLTVFGASLFVPPSRVHFIFPEPAAAMNYVVLLTCAVSLVTYMVMAVILRKLDQLDISRVRVIPFCGKRGRFKYEILVKTGWGRGSGTTAHVGIMLYGVDSRSGHRHLDGNRAFHRNSLDIFQIATPHSLGSVWKIRVWHDNKGLSPAWFLQHIIVRDLQNARSTFFLVNDWLSVETEANGGLVEKEVLAASEAALWRFQRLLVAELQRGFFDKHIWLSIWDRSPRSRFTRVQRATCCFLLICLFLGANAVWYGVVGDTTYSPGPVSSLIPLNVDTIAIGLVSSVVVYPVYLAILFLFRMSRSKDAGGLSPTPAGQQVLDIDSCLDSTVLDSSFLTFPGLRAEAFTAQMKSDLFLDDSKSLVFLLSSEGTLGWPDLLSDPSIMGSSLQRLAQGHAGLVLGPEEDSLSLVSPSSPAKYFSASDEDLIQQVLAEGTSSLAPTQDTEMETDVLTGLSSALGEKREMVTLQSLGDKGLPRPGLTWEQPQAARFSRTGLVEGLRKQLLPAWCASLAHGLSLLLVAVALGVSGWVGASFPTGVSVMWLLSSTSSFLASFVGWEPLKVLLEALYFSLVAKRLHPDEDDTLVESPAVTPVSERVPRVRPPHGFALFLAKEEARKVKRLHSMLRNLLVYMLFLLVTLLANYGDASCQSHAYRLQSAIKQELDSRTFLAITRSEEFWPWMSHVLLPYIHGNQSSPELGPPRLRQVRLQNALGPTGAHMCSASGGFSTANYSVGWASAAYNSSKTWAYSAPDLLGAWYWGYCAVYDSGGYVQELSLSLEDSRAQLGFLQLHNWLDNRSRAVFVELTRYSPAVGLHAAITLRLEFPVAGHAVTGLSIRPFTLQRLSAGLSLQLLTSVFLLLFALYFSAEEARTWHREGRARALRPGAWAQWLLVTLTAAAGLVRLAQLGTADHQWTRFVHGRPRRFTSFDQVAQLSAVARGLAASVLFLLLVKAAQQLRFVRQWSVFGKTLRRALPELAGATFGLAVLGAAYAQLAVLLVSCVESLQSAAQALLVLCPGAGAPILCQDESWCLSPLLCVGLWALRLWGALKLGAVLLRWRYHTLRGELYRPAWEPQDYEMVELFLRRLRLWMGFSKVKEFRHKVRFEGMEPLPSRSSRGSRSAPEAPLPSAGSQASHPSTSSSQLDGLSVGPGQLGVKAEPEPSRLQTVFEALLTQFDRLNQATEDVYQLEQQLQSLQGHRSSQAPAMPPCGPSPGLQPGLPSHLARACQAIDLATGTSKASLWAKNKVHPSST
ncbi:polycystin-1 isoform X4 [Nycticebus coucang]|uniref:polycystin-1 isoform X4 n=1 Tax=Nycticebus coucang TaxID=9470 RepID=UPI00234D1DE5|nr:polycystin-1 isoform X4 [Nycticebus coucang]